MSMAIAEPEIGNTTLMFIALAVVLAILRAVTSQHYFMVAVTVLQWFRDRMVRGMDGEAKTSAAVTEWRFAEMRRSA
jgi:hypothetical protein